MRALFKCLKLKRALSAAGEVNVDRVPASHRGEKDDDAHDGAVSALLKKSTDQFLAVGPEPKVWVRCRFFSDMPSEPCPDGDGKKAFDENHRRADRDKQVCA